MQNCSKLQALSWLMKVIIQGLIGPYSTIPDNIPRLLNVCFHTNLVWSIVLLNHVCALRRHSVWSPPPMSKGWWSPWPFSTTTVCNRSYGVKCSAYPAVLNVPLTADRPSRDPDNFSIHYTWQCPALILNPDREWSVFCSLTVNIWVLFSFTMKAGLVSFCSITQSCLPERDCSKQSMVTAFADIQPWTLSVNTMNKSDGTVLPYHVEPLSCSSEQTHGFFIFKSAQIPTTLRSIFTSFVRIKLVQTQSFLFLDVSCTFLTPWNVFVKQRTQVFSNFKL